MILTEHYLAGQLYQERMITHWSTFVSRAELEELVTAGVSHVRIPLGGRLSGFKPPLNHHCARLGYWYWDVELDEPFPPPNMNVTDPASPLYYLREAVTVEKIENEWKFPFQGEWGGVKTIDFFHSS